MKTDLLNLNFCNETLELKDKIENSFLELGARLLKIRDENLFLPQWSTFAEYALELGWSEAKASKLINIYQKFIVQFSFPIDRILKAGGWSCLAEGLALVKDKESAEEVLSQAETLSRPDFRIWKNEKITGIQQQDCKHEDTYTLKICRHCGIKEIL